MNVLRKLTEQQKNQKALKIKNKIIKQTQDIKLAENLSPITTKLSEVIDKTKRLVELIKNFDVADENTQTRAMEKITGTKSIRDTYFW